MTEADLAGRAFGREQVEDGTAALVAEQLAQVLLVKADPVGAQQVDEIAGPIGAQGVAGETRLTGQEAPLVIAVKIREVAATSARNADLLAEPGHMVDDDDTQATLPGLGRAELAGRAGADHRNIDSFHRRNCPWTTDEGRSMSRDRVKASARHKDEPAWVQEGGRPDGMEFADLHSAPFG